MRPTTLIRVISLADARSRREAMGQRLAGTGWQWSFFDAHRRPAESLSYSERDAWVAKGRPLVPQELGCYSSHYCLWQEFVAGAANQLFVLEDDAFGDWKYIGQDVLPVHFGDIGIHLLRLCVGYPARCRQHGWLKDRRIFKFLGHMEKAVAYIISREGAERLLEHCRRIQLPIDDEMDRSWIHGVHSFALVPSPIIELREISQIPDRDRPTARNPYALARIRYRIEDKTRNWLMR
jgi:glycosyl transferase, family 25